MVTIPIHRCPVCGGEVVEIERHFREWKCSKCGRTWGIGVRKPVFLLGGVVYVGGRKY